MTPESLRVRSKTAESLNRRTLLKLGAVAMAASTTGCGTIPFFKPPVTCVAPAQSTYPRIDMHCHLMNMRDIDVIAFLNRRIINSDETSALVDLVVGVFTRVSLTPGYLSASRADWEVELLTRNRAELQIDSQRFCEFARKEQWGLFFANDNTQLSGFLSDRSRNAARMMAQFQDIDLFTPSMVDMFEGQRSNLGLQDQVLFYEQLNIATNGRFVPLVSFNPEHEYLLRKQGMQPYPLDIVKTAIAEKGFIGVKVHPSSGFSPYDNKKYGCPNSPLQMRESLSAEEIKSYDESMAALFAFCRAEGVPILTHSGPGISANRRCMQKDKNLPLDWTNSPRTWVEAMVEADKGGGDHLRVCLGHFAGGYRDDIVFPWLEFVAAEIERHPGLYTDVSHVMDFIPDDMSGSRYVRLIKYMRERPALTRKLMYGSDWHMPAVAMKGTRFLAEWRKFFSELEPQTVDRVMGLTAVDFLGLKQDQPNRRRLEAFYSKNQVSLNNVGWLRKLRAAGL